MFFWGAFELRATRFFCFGKNQVAVCKTELEGLVSGEQFTTTSHCFSASFLTAVLAHPKI